MNLNRKLRLLFIVIAFGLILATAACAVSTDFTHQDEIARVPLGDPDFPNLGDYWVIDTMNVVDSDAVAKADAKLEELNQKGYAQQAIVVMPGISHMSDYAIQMIRHLELGNADGPRANNGLLWLVVTDAPEGSRVHYAVGLGLPEITSFDTGPIIEAASVYADQGDWAKTVETLTTESEKMLKAKYPELEPTPDPAATSTPEEGEGGEELDGNTILVIIVVVIAIIVIGIILYVIDPELGALWFEFWLRILAAAASSGGGGGRKGGGGGRSVRGR